MSTIPVNNASLNFVVNGIYHAKIIGTKIKLCVSVHGIIYCLKAVTCSGDVTIRDAVSVVDVFENGYGVDQARGFYSESLLILFVYH